jgi:Uma2 family endonuclease
MAAMVEAGYYGRPIQYPERDGEPMAETDIHRDEMVDTIDALKHRYQLASDVYVAGNLLIYFQEGDPKQRFAPDVFVVFGVPKRKRRTYKLWEEKKAPDFVLELTSRGTRYEDKGSKKGLCAELGVSEYFLFDPEADYLDPPLQGFRLVNGRYEPIAPRPDGSLRCETLGLFLARESDGRLRLIDAATGEHLLRPEEARQEREEALARADEETRRADEETRRADAAEAELARLRAMLGER